ncbi:amidase [Amycolatopsis sp.]|uniref:amidase n=1 Tax=Amycolatopsis sp. TaxID=37632 RepID=UPI002D7F01E5|nr:amidase [Amycolatopsis sp.]HET6705054.1 amidase [Amycolatopsis sp.]
MSDLHELTAIEQTALVRARTISPVELADHYLDRIDRLDRALGSFVTVTADAARAAAKEAEARVVRSAVDELPPLHGVPIAFKDLTATAGVPTKFGSLALADNVPPFDADVVKLLNEAGVVGLGKTTTSELGISLSCETELGPPTHSPWRPGLMAGGSSGGAAAAVAAGLVPFAQGSDGAGSLRVPAALCGVVGVKPSRGLVSHGPLHSGMFGMPINGPVARTVADAALLLDAMAVAMPGEPYFCPPPPPEGSYLAALHRPLRRADGRPLRVGRHAEPLLAETVVDPEVLGVWERTGKLLESLGCEVFDVPAPFDPSIGPLFQQVFSVLSAMPMPPSRERLLQPLTRHVRAEAAKVSAVGVLGILSQLQNAARAAMRALADVDLVLTPTVADVAVPLGYFTEPGDPAEHLARQRRFSPFCAPYNLTGQPAVSLPVGQSGDGLPIGVMLAAHQGEDAMLLAVSAELERAAPWVDRKPPVW